MSEYKAAYRYALALIGVAEEVKALDAVNKDLSYIEEMHRESSEFMSFLKSPVVNKEKKKSVFTELFRGKVNELTLKFILLLTTKDKEGILPEIIQQFYRLRDERLGILNVAVRTAVKFSDAQEKSLVNNLEQSTKKKIRLKYVIDKSIKGGFTVQHEDTVWDASVRHQLELLRLRFAEGIV
jgi:F-type H+-transporting ATPase subunit delta